jgi:hypothetical protein
MVCPHCGCEFEPAGTRSSRANRYYWGVVMALLSRELGYTAEEVHDAMKAKFRGREDITTGLVIAKSTRVNSAEFWAYVEQVREWSHQFLGVYIPAPNEPADEWRAA